MTASNSTRVGILASAIGATLAVFAAPVAAQMVATTDATPWSEGVVSQIGQAVRGPAVKQSWSAWGGHIGVRWSTDLLKGYGITVSPDAQLSMSDERQHQWFSLRESGGLEFAVANGSLKKFNGGSLQMRGGYVLHLRDGSTIDLRNATLRVRDSDPGKLDLVSSDGKIWLYTDRVMFELADRNQTMAVRAADLRIMPALAERMNAPDAVNLEIADMAMTTQVYVTGDNALDPKRTCSPYPYPGVAVPSSPNDTYQADLFMQGFTVSQSGCALTASGTGSGSCDGPGGTDGFASMVPSSTLINNKNDGTSVATVAGDPLGTSSAKYAANVAWYQMFTTPSPPYNNDQHPNLIWNLYRVAADGSIDQIGRSGTKHAFLTTNGGCLDSCNNSHSLGLGCSDTYGTGNNDSPSDMGPRSEILPAAGIWGRCGSIWDPLTGAAPGTCTGTSHGNGNTSWTQRMLTRESQIEAASNPGATYFFESWYIARDDINIYNSMGTITGTPTYSMGGHTWTLTGALNYKLGPAIDRWVSPTAPPANAKSAEIANSEGHTKVAVKATNLGNGTWRYDYAVMNLDFARGLIDPAHNLPPNIHLFHNFGFDRFRVLIAPNVTVSNIVFSDGDLDTSNDWTGTVDGGPITWTAPVNPNPIANVPPVLNPLNWGTLYKFSFVANAAPINITTSLHVAQAGDPVSYEAVVLGPSSDEVLVGNFDSAVPPSATPVSLDWSK